MYKLIIYKMKWVFLIFSPTLIKQIKIIVIVCRITQLLLNCGAIYTCMNFSFYFFLWYSLWFSQVISLLHASRKWTRVPPTPVTIMPLATRRMLVPWGLDVAAQQGSLALHVLNQWISVPWTPVPMECAAVWAITTGACVSQVCCTVNIVYIICQHRLFGAIGLLSLHMHIK